MTALKSSLGRAARGVYHRLPISWKTRLALKSILFRALAPLLRNTNAYHRWYLDARMRDLPTGLAPNAAVEHAPVSTSVPEIARERRYADQVLALATARSPDYAAAPADAPPPALRAKAIAFYLPQFHPIPENDAWWGRGFTEWTNVGKAAPQFVGHEQPKLPGELGYYDLRLVEVMRRQAELAKLHGVYGFCFHYYWFAGRRLLERPLDQYLADDAIDFPFCLCWANENWTRRWDGHDADVLLGQNYCDESDERFIRDILPYLSDRRYIRIDGRPLLIMYRPSLLPDARRTLNTWRQRARDAGLGELFLAMVQFDVEDPRTYGFDAALEFPPHKLAGHMPPINESLEIVNPDYAGMVLDYRELARRAMHWPVPDYPLFRGLSPGWDNEARKPGRGYTFAHSTPAAYREWLSACADYAAAHPVAGERVVFVNAWNEWAEGAYLEPDRRYGYAYLHATRAALSGHAAPLRIALISHDAHPHGAQYLALNLLRELRRMQVDVEVLLQGEGRLEAEFAAFAPLHRLYALRPDQIAALAVDLRARGVQSVIANTAVSGRVVAALHAAGLRVVSLIHELPGVIAEYGLENALRTLGEVSARIVAPSVAVRDGLSGLLPSDVVRDKLVLRPQGLFTRSRYRGLDDLSPARAALRRKLGLADDAAVVLAVGYADRRKGLDLLAQAAIVACAKHADLHVVWVGHREVGLQPEVDALLAQAGIASRFHFVGLDFDTDDYYAGADVYALASREDPFPSVVLESLSVGTPVVAFAGTGGGADLIDGRAGLTVPAFDVDAYAAALLRVVGDASLRARLGEAGRALVNRDFSFRRYALDLLDFAGHRSPRISAVVPNYNYAHYLPQRLESLSSQTLPLLEILVLDDASTDDSLEVLQAERGRIHPEPELVRNARNSGSVFRQWAAGVRRAQGEFVWIAEADDLAHPQMLAALAQPMLADPSIVMAYCQSEQMDSDGGTLAPDYLAYTDDLDTRRWRSSYTASGAEEAACALAVKNTVPNVSAALFRRDALLAVLEAHEEDIVSYRVAGDWVVYLRLLTRGRIHFHPEPLNRHRRHAASVTTALNRQRHYDEVVAAQAIAQRLYPLDASVRAAAAEYAERLRVQFELPSATPVEA